MIPLRQVRRSQHAPIVTRALAVALAAVFAWQVLLAHSGGALGSSEAFFVRWGVRPRCVVDPESCSIAFSTLRDEPWPVLRRWVVPLWSSAFLHAGAAHLAFNAWFLWVFGPAVEEKLGRCKYLALYFSSAAASALCHVAASPHSTVPLVGASGAIAGILGAHLVLMPRAWVLSYVPPHWVVPVPSIVFLLFWVAGQVAGAASEGASSGTAWAAHIGGFAFGAFCVWSAKPEREPTEPREEAPERKKKRRA